MTDKLKRLHGSDGDVRSARFLLYVADERRFDVWRKLDGLVRHRFHPLGFAVTER